MTHQCVGANGLVMVVSGAGAAATLTPACGGRPRRGQRRFFGSSSHSFSSRFTGSAWDAWLAASLSADALRQKPFTPLPVLGVPGWWQDNQDPAFYGDAGVFRPRRVPA